MDFDKVLLRVDRLFEQKNRVINKHISGCKLVDILFNTSPEIKLLIID